MTRVCGCQREMQRFRLTEKNFALCVSRQTQAVTTRVTNVRFAKHWQIAYVKRGFNPEEVAVRRVGRANELAVKICRIWPMRCDGHDVALLGFGVCFIRSGANVERRKWP